jgi:acetyl esterase/lipase
MLKLQSTPLRSGGTREIIERMKRRTFLAACVGSAFAQANRDPDDPKNPYPEDQHPESPRGRALADFARSLKIRRGIPFVNRPEGELTLAIYEPRNRPRRPIPCVLAFGISAFYKNQTNYRWDLDNLMASPTPNLYPPSLARNRVVVVANLRLSTQAMWPAQIHDAKCALRWVKKNSATLDIDPARVAMFGASASGNLSALVALTGDTGQLDDPAGDRKVTTTVKAACCLSTPTDWVYYKDVDPGNKSLFKDVIPPYLGNDDHLYQEASPYTYVHRGGPPFFLSHGKQDERVPYSQMPHFAAALEKAGVSVETWTIDHFQHGPIRGVTPEPDYPATDAKIYAFFDHHLGDKA